MSGIVCKQEIPQSVVTKQQTVEYYDYNTVILICALMSSTILCIFTSALSRLTLHINLIGLSFPKLETFWEFA